MPVVVTRDQDGRAARLREPLRASRLAARAQRARRGAQHHLRLSQLELRSCRQSHRRRVPPRARRQGRHAGGLPARRRTARASCASRRSPAWSSARCRQTRRRSSTISGAEIVGPHPPRDAGAGEAARRLQPGAAEQLEALHGERQGQLSREPAAHVLHHLPPQPAVAEGRHRGERVRRPSRQLFARRRHRRQGIRAGRHARRAGGLRARGARAAGSGRRVRRRHRRCRSCRCSRPSCCSRPATAWRCAAWCRRASSETELVWTCFGFTDDDEDDDRAPPAAGQPDRPGRLHLDGGRRRAGLRAARGRGAADRARRWSRWAARSVASDDNRVTEAAVRGFWKAYAAYMGI